MKLTTRPLSVLPAATVRATFVRGRTTVVEPDPVVPEPVAGLGDGALALLTGAAAGALAPGLDIVAELLVALLPALGDAAVPSEEAAGVEDGEAVDPVEVEEVVPAGLGAEPLPVLCAPVGLGSVVPAAGAMGGIAGPGAAGVLPLGEAALAGPGWVTPGVGIDVGVPVSPELR